MNFAMMLLLLNLGISHQTEVVPRSPEELANYTLLIPRFDLFDPEDEEMKDKSREYLLHHNQEARRFNSALIDAAAKSYSYRYELVRMADVSKKVQEGGRYLLEVVNIKKGGTIIPDDILSTPANERYSIAEKMYRVPQKGEWHLFMIRDLKTGDLYLPSGWKGSPELIVGLSKFLKAAQ